MEKEIIKAWEKLPEGYYDSETMSEWLSEDMKPVIDECREKLKESVSEKITDEILGNYKNLFRSGNSWKFLFEIYGLQTKFIIENLNNNYIVSIKQIDSSNDCWNLSILLGLVKETTDLEQLFLSITRGEKLN
tara:strand:+ start:70 stop:468 length:399 start_codon:yes stop_codon:yes gene_type:complete